MNCSQVNSALKNNVDEKLKYFASKFHIMETTEIEESPIADIVDSPSVGKVIESIAEEIHNQFEVENSSFLNEEHEIGMSCELTTIPEKHLKPSKLVIEKCSTKKQFRDFGKVMASVTDLEEGQVELFYELVALIPANQRKEIVFFLGYINRVPVSTCCLFFTDVAGVYDLATSPQHRGKGYGTALFYHALKEAKRREYQTAVLQATEDGMNIYQRFGFIPN